jgi:hypothetical protein
MANRGLIVSFLFAVSTPSSAFNIDRLQNLSQSDFRLLAEDAGAALSYHPQTPTEPLGLAGFDVGFSVTLSKLANKDVWSRASSESVPSYIPIPTLRANKGLPFGVDVGLMYAAVPGSNVSLLGGEARWAFIRGGVATPAVGIRGTLTRLGGVDQMDLTTKGLDLSASKGFAVFTPYVGVGRTWVTSEPNVPNLAREDFALNKFFAGAGFNLLLLNMNVEVDRTGDSTAYSVKAGLRF